MFNNNMYNINPNPIGNINQGYYSSNNQYNTHFNPYLAIRQQQAQEAQMKEQLRSQSNMMKKISRAVNSESGISEEALDEMYDYKHQDPYNIDYESYDYMNNLVYNLHVNALQYYPEDVQYVNHFNNLYDTARSQIPDDISMYEFNEKMSTQYVDMLIANDRQKQKDVSKLYNSNQYNALLNGNSSSSNYFNSIFNGSNGMNNNSNIDDQEISIPLHLSNEYQSRRKQFLESILNKG